jgi:hypothetical protein
MNGNIFLRTGVLVLALGMGVGIYMGAKEDFTFAPAHAHLNLAGGVLMCIAGLFYNSRPALSGKLTTIHYIIQLVGAVLLAAGIAGAQVRAPWFPPVVGAGSVLTLLAMLFFVFMVFKGTVKNATAA